MSSSVNLDLLLDLGPQGTFEYFGGHDITGTVALTSDEPHMARGLYVEVYGKARIRWSTGSGSDQETHEGEELYLNSRTYFFGKSIGQAIEIQPGIHKYNFSFSLPRQLPYSLDIPHGEIKYHVKCVLDIPLAFDKEVVVPFGVLSHLDLNSYDELKSPQSFEFNEKFTSPIKMVVSLPFTGYVPNQEVPITISFVNNSSINVERTIVTFKQQITFIPNSKIYKKVTDQDYPLQYLPGIKAHSDETITTTIKIPQVIATNEFCEVITVRYFLKVKAEVGKFHSSPVISIPITIGDVALGANYQSNVELPAPTAPMNPLGPIAPTAPLDDTDLPPSFEEAIKMPKVENSIGWDVHDKS